MKNCIYNRISMLNKIVSHDSNENVDNSQSFVKEAFDTRRINQNTQYNPRRNLQYYVREQPFISDIDNIKVMSLAKLKEVTDSLKEDFNGEPEWFDSYASDLDHILEKTFFKSDGKNFDFSSTHIQYLEQLLQNRYRLKLSDISNSNFEDLKKCIIHKDERLEKSNIYKSGDNSKINKNKLTNIINKDVSHNVSLPDIMQSVSSDEQKLNQFKLEKNAIDDNLNNKKDLLHICKQEKNIHQKIVANKTNEERIILQKLWSDHNAMQKAASEIKNIEEILENNENEIFAAFNTINKEKSILNELIKSATEFSYSFFIKDGADQLKVSNQINDNLEKQKHIMSKIVSMQNKIANNENYKIESVRLINKLSNDIDNFTKNMTANRPIYDSVNFERLELERIFKEKCEEEQNINKELLQLQINANNINSNYSIIENRIKSNLKLVKNGK